MTSDQIADLFQTLLTVFVGAGEKVATFRRVIEAYSAHRDATNAAEACRLAGFDPQEIEITDADIRRLRAS